jgi:conjugal transfer pilus assembly protein TraI
MRWPKWFPGAEKKKARATPDAGQNNEAGAACADASETAGRMEDSDGLRYPPFPKGLPAKPAEDLLAGQSELVAAIARARGLCGGHNAEEAEILVHGPARHLARLAHLLPASEKEYFNAPGGLFRFGLECGLNAYRLAETRILARGSPETRRDTERLWSHAAFLAGLYSETVRTLSALAVYSSDGDQWHPGSEPLADWLSGNRKEKYFIMWKADPDPAMASAVTRTVLPHAQAIHLSKGNPEILSTLMAAIARPSDMHNPVVRIVLTVRGKLIERDQASNPAHFGQPYTGLHMEPWLIDAMRHLVQSRKWRANEERARIWVGEDGVFLVWPAAAADIQQDLRDNQSPFIPRNAATLADILARAKVFSRNGAGYLFEIAVPQAASPERRSLDAVRLASAEILFEGAPPDSVGVALAKARADDGLDAPEEETPAPPEPVGKGPAGKPGKAENPGKAKPDAKPKPKPKSASAAGDAEISPDEFYADWTDAGGGMDADVWLAEIAETPGSHERPAADPRPDTENAYTDVLAALTAPAGPESGPGREPGPFGPGDPRDEARARAGLILDRLRRLPKEALSCHGPGVTRVEMDAVKKTPLPLDETVSTLKAAGLIEPVGGRSTGIDGSGGRFFLVKSNLLPPG